MSFCKKIAFISLLSLTACQGSLGWKMPKVDFPPDHNVANEVK